MACKCLGALHLHVATYRHHCENGVDDPDSYGGIDWLSNTSQSKDRCRVIKDLKDKTNNYFPFYLESLVIIRNSVSHI